MLFIVIDVTEALSHVLKYFGVSEDDAPTARIINMETGKKFTITAGELTADSLGHLCQEVVDGTAKVTHTHTHTCTHTLTYECFISSQTAELNPVTCLVLWCSPTIDLRRFQRTGIRHQSKSWWGKILSLLLWTRPKMSLWSSVSQFVCLPESAL